MAEKLEIPSPEELGLSLLSTPAPRKVSTRSKALDPTTRELRDLGVVSLQLFSEKDGYRCECLLKTSRPGLKHSIQTDAMPTEAEALQIALDGAREWCRSHR